MPLTSEQNIPDKPKEKSEPWTFRRLFPFSSAITTLSKAFASPFDILLGYLMIVLSIAELIGRNVSWTMWILTALIFFAVVAEHYIKLKESKLEEKTKETK